jgi:hypothetical protein
MSEFHFVITLTYGIDKHGGQSDFSVVLIRCIA